MSLKAVPDQRVRFLARLRPGAGCVVQLFFLATQMQPRLYFCIY